MAHCGYEATAVTDAIRRPVEALRVAMRPIRVDGPMAPEIPLDGQRPAEYVFETLVQQAATDSPEVERRTRQQSHAA
ncbi:MAG: adenosyl-hopene transferase HpnH, partial [Geminicoccales bacterium]